MDLNDTPEQAAYRAAGARLARGAQGAGARGAQRRGAAAEDDETSTRAARWQGKLAEGGLAGVTWPKEYGGQGVGPDRAGHRQPGDRAARGVPGILDVIGVGMLGPTIIAHGTDEQKGRYLGPMLHGDEVWCQLFSEPAAGSDLAAVQTRARQDDDGSVGAQRPEGVDDQRAVRRLRPAARAHRPRRCPSTRA